jgi:peptide-methionine (S)-S-oxide reductase
MGNNKNNLMPDRETATLAGGCFWCLEAVFLELNGVEKVVSGYSGGLAEQASYSEVSSGTTGHAEAVHISFDHEIISYRDILEVFFTIHDPTTLNRQGADVGTQYRSAVFYKSDQQKSIAEQLIQELDRSNIWDHKIVTDVTPFKNFYPAEDYHQDYYKKNSQEPYCQLIIAPKVAKLRQHFITKLKKQ